MMRWMVGSSVNSRRVVIALAALAMIFGFQQIRDMPRDVLPEFTPPTVEVQTEALGLSAAEVEEFITVPLEQDLLNGVAYLDTIRSESIPGLSSIEMIFEPGTDILDARQVVAERLTQAAVGLPGVQSSLPQMLQPLSSTNRVMMAGMSSDEVSLIDMSILARWTIRPKLMGVPGVANVSVWGSRERQLQVLVDPERLRANDVTLRQIIETTANSQFVSSLSFVEASTPGTGGIIETPAQRIGVQHGQPYATPDDLAGVALEGSEGLKLGDVTDVVEDHQLLIGDAASSEGPPSLMLVVEKFPGANALEVSQGVDSALDNLGPGLEGIEVDSSLFRPATYLETSNANLSTALIIGGLLMLLALGALLFDWRTALISVISAAASLLVAGLVLSMFDVTLNAMIIAGLVLALVVVIDDAVGSATGVAQRLRQDQEAGGGTSMSRTMIGAFIELRSAALYGALISLVALLPVFFTRGSFGAFFPSIALAYAVAVLASMVVALMVTPAITGLFMSRVSHEDRESPVVRWLRPRYERGLAKVGGSARPALILVGGLLVCGLVALPFLGLSLSPEFKDTNLLVHLDGPPGTSLTEMNRVAGLVGGEISEVPGVLKVGGHAGRALVADQVVGTNSSEVWVTLDPEADYDATRASIEEVVDGYPGLDRSVVTYPSERIGEVLAESEDPVTVRVFGQQLDIVRSKADEVRELLTGIEGVENPRVQIEPVEPTLEIQVDLEKAERVGIVPGDVRRAASTLLSGIHVGSLFDEQKVFDVVVWGTPEVRHDLSRVQNLPIDTPDGGRVRLGDVARVRIAQSPAVIRHEAVSRSMDVTADVSGRDLGAVEAEVERGLQGIEYPIEYHAELVTDFAENQAIDREAMWFAVATVIAIFLLMQAGVGSWRLASALSVMLPLSLAGGAIAVLVTGRMVTLGSVAGFLAVLGIAARHTIMQVKHVQHVELHEGETFGRDLVLRGARERFVPVLTSVFAIALFFIPLALAGPIAGLELVHPMAVVILGGLVSSTLFSLLIVPVLHGRFGTGSEADVSVVLEEERTIDLTKPELTRS
ncbi:MAG: efflux RND transporter permease subunit [Actinomycetota bacterium]|nr:efflux RND transporter permease subunit [Actinomycetota bacterium]